MNKVIPNLWIGDLSSALALENLKQNGIRSVLSVIRGRVNVHPTFIRYHVELDDMEDSDILVHFSPCIAFIEAELGKGRGVLVHCQAGISRSPTIVAAYLMYSRKLTPQEAIELIQKGRPFIDPNPGFLCQLDVFHHAGYTSSRSVASVRRYYLDRTAIQIQEGCGGIGEGATDILAGLPGSVAPYSTSDNPAHHRRRRRIRCKMCRQELATREFMLDHGQVGPPTPRSASPSPLDAEGSTVPGPFPVLETQLTSDPAPNTSTDPPPILIDNRCSGYFIEPLKWMGPFLKDGELAGKIVCPNQKCKAKLGNYDWAGTKCGCNQWVIPGFCVSRSKVDEVTR